MSVTENIAGIEERIQKACDKAGRKRDEITLMGVTKFVPITLVEEAWRAGIRCFGESRVKEGIEKFETFRKDHPDVSLHLIGSLQRNKAKTAALFFDCIQSVDREELIDELARHAGADKPLEVLLELHTGEETKSGFADLESLFKAAEKVCSRANLKPAGLMTMAPYTEDEQLIRSSFKKVVEARKELAKRWPRENWSCLSMGMSNDFEIAVEEGASLLRVGSLIFKDL
jgi:pyridoxal phosphate enzyme (YggS family)